MRRKELCFKIHRNGTFSYLAAHSHHLLMFGMHRVCIKGFTTSELYHKPRVERAVKSQDIGPDVEALDARHDIAESTQSLNVICTHFRLGLGFVFPTDDMDQHLFFSFAPFFCGLVAIFEHLLDPRQDEKRCCKIAYDR